jgi:peptide/nickel transport system substrate-binding protein
MQKKSIVYLLLCMVTIIAFAIGGCSPQATPPATTSPSSPPPAATGPQRGGQFTMISPYAPSSFGYPVKGVGFAYIFANQPTVESLIDADIKGNLLPALATSWATAPDKSSITVTLKKGVKFHDGTDFNAQAAKWNLDLYLARATGSPADWKSIDIVDDYTVRINLKTFKNTQVSNLTSYYMISPAAVQQNSVDWATTHPIGTGPFKFKAFVPNTSLEFDRFDGYWGDKALVDTMKFIYIVDATTASLAFKAGDALVWEGADAKASYGLKSAGGYYQSNRRGPMMNLIPDSANADSPFSKLEVRQAIEYAIDRPAIVKAFGYDSWEAVDQPAAPEQFGHIDNPKNTRPYNPEKAKELLKQAGYPNGFTTTIIASAALPKDPVVAIQDFLSKVGITANVDIQAPAKWADTRAAGWKNALFCVTHGATDFNYCAYLERYYVPKGLYSYPVLAYPQGWVEGVTNMMLSSDPKEYQAMAKQLVQTHIDNAMVIPLWIQSEVYTLNNKVKDMGVGAHGNGFNWNVNKVWISK